ncbi:RNA 2'-phosphotransferase [Hazenella coriacea]|uniref:RNA 2'-phosphotransferase n=1 Tax=Hazenella coriacea TaxID=1179467 RepID=UPI001FB22CAF|nr:RNA 2'-phosphotransferase [Hazenella coriacea]
MSKRHTRVSKFLSLILRHQPELVNLSLDEAGWVNVSQLLEGCRKAGVKITLEELKEIVRTNDKRRFSFTRDFKYIRANQGHSVEVQLGLQPTSPPITLFHGTAKHFLPSIFKEGLLKKKRHHVHLSDRRSAAVEVGKRHGFPIVLQIDAGKMEREGVDFYRTENGVWLVDHVPPKYICFPTDLTE